MGQERQHAFQYLAFYRRRTLAKVQAQVKVLHNRRIRLQKLRSQLATTLSASRLLRELCHDQASAAMLGR